MTLLIPKRFLKKEQNSYPVIYKRQFLKKKLLRRIGETALISFFGQYVIV